MVILLLNTTYSQAHTFLVANLLLVMPEMEAINLAATLLYP